jgi:hypothetical protein
MVFVLVEKAPPFAVAVVELDDDAIEAGMRARREAIDLYHVCAEADYWPAYSATGPISLPRWASRKFEESA